MLLVVSSGTHHVFCWQGTALLAEQAVSILSPHIDMYFVHCPAQVLLLSFLRESHEWASGADSEDLTGTTYICTFAGFHSMCKGADAQAPESPASHLAAHPG